MISELTDKHDADFQAFWESRHPLPLQDARFDPDSPLSRVWAEWDVYGRIVSACVLAPYIEQGICRGHHAYLASYHKSKCLIRFCRESMKQMVHCDVLGLICVQTRQDENLACMDKLAKFLGFQAVYVPGEAFTDYIWNAKQERKLEPCHQ